jgi:hypothetical protein
MGAKSEGLALQPFPTGKRRDEEGLLAAAWARKNGPEPRCEMCGAVAIAAHCKRICLRCGFMTGCSEGV